jgi:hypothetical protein
VADAFGESKQPIAESERAKARSFCLAESGQWAKEREVVCSLAGIDPDAFRQKCMVLAARPQPRFESGEGVAQQVKDSEWLGQCLGN